LLHIHPDYQLNFRVNLDKGGLDRLLSKLLETRSTDRRHSSAAGLSAHTVKKMGLRWSSWHSAKKAGQWPRTRYRERRERRVSHTHVIICCQQQTKLSARPVSAHSLSSTSLLSVLILSRQTFRCFLCGGII